MSWCDRCSEHAALTVGMWTDRVQEVGVVPNNNDTGNSQRNKGRQRDESRSGPAVRQSMRGGCCVRVRVADLTCLSFSIL